VRLIYHAGALGDFITSLPAIAAWRGSERAILLGRPAHASLAQPGFDDAWDAGGGRFAALFARGSVFDGSLVALFAGIDAALVFAAASSPLPDSLRALGVGIVHRHDPFPASAVPIVDYHLAAVGAARLAGAVPRVTIGAPGAVMPGPDTVAIAPGSGSEAKNWPREAFIALSGLLEQQGLSTAWVIGPAEGTLAIPPGVRAWKDLGLAALAAALAGSRLFVGNDSGVTHLAAACGCPTIALFGPSDPGVWAPRGRAVRVVTSRTGAMQGVSVQEVYSACCDCVVVQERRRTEVRRGGEP
jgi:hypothetical protein